MVRGILMSKEGQKAILLTNDGSFVKVRLRKGAQVSVGQNVMDSDIAVRLTLKQKIPITLAACLTVFIVFGMISGFVRNNAIAAYVSIDVNPSIEAAINRDFRIVNVKGLNDDGKAILNNGIHYKNMSVKEFSLAIADVLSERGYMSNKPDIVVSTILTDKVDQSKREMFNAQLNQAISKLKSNRAFQKNKGTLEVLHTTMNKREEAKKAGLSTGKYLIYLEEGKNNKNLHLKQVKKMTVKEIRQSHSKKTETVQVHVTPPGKDKKAIKNEKGHKDHHDNGHSNDVESEHGLKTVEKLAQPKKPKTIGNKGNTPSLNHGENVQKGSHKGVFFPLQEGHPINPFHNFDKPNHGKQNKGQKRAG